MNILAISGSGSLLNSNVALLEAIMKLFSNKHTTDVYHGLRDFPLFRPEDLEQELPKEVKTFKEKLTKADFIFISTPEYTHNIPAVLKNAFEWVTASGEFQHKKVFPITFTPHPPRGKYAMQSLLTSLKAMDATIVGQLSLYKNEVNFEGYTIHLSKELNLLFDEVIVL